MVLQGTDSNTYSVGNNRKVSLQLDDPYGAVIGQADVLMTLQGDSGGETLWNGFFKIEKGITSGPLTLLYNGKPDDLSEAAVLTGDKVSGQNIILGTALRGWYD